MRIVVLKDAQDVANFGANQIISLLKVKPKSTLGLATGSSPLNLYQKLIESNKQKHLTFNNITTFNLDEYLGLDENHPQSYRYFMNEKLFKHIDIKIENTHVPNGSSNNPIESCELYESQIANSGGIDLQLLGIGSNGHIGFNEPSSSLVSRTRVKTLAKDTVEANKRFFDDDQFQPHLSITMGIGTIMDAKKIILIATGRTKADAIKATIEGPVSANCPASILQMHANATVIVDQEAAYKLDNLHYYEHIEFENQRLLKAINQNNNLN